MAITGNERTEIERRAMRAALAEQALEAVREYVTAGKRAKLETGGKRSSRSIANAMRRDAKSKFHAIVTVLEAQGLDKP